MNMKKVGFLVVASALSLVAAADDIFDLDRPSGIKVGTRMTIRPYVSFSYTFDSNVDCMKRSENASSLQINPGVNFDYAGDNWKLLGSLFYRYSAYLSGYSDQLNNHNYGERLNYTWNDGFYVGKGWALSLSETFRLVNQDDSALSDGGRGIWRDRQEFTANGTLQRRFNEHWHAGLLLSYYWLHYDNDQYQYAPLYGWQRWQGNLQLGYILSKWTDLFIQGGYQGCLQTNDENGNGTTNQSIDRQSSGYTVHVGFGSFMTERITYRISGGWSRFDYGDVYTADGFTYRASLDWKIGETWRTTLLAASYYQPSEREYGSATRNDYVTWGLTKSLVRSKLQATLDLTYRRETRAYTANPGTASDYDLDLLSARIGLNYSLNRFLSVYARYEYQLELNDTRATTSTAYDYDRQRFTVGCRLTY